MIDSVKILESIRTGKDEKALQLLYKIVLPKIKNYIIKNNGSIDEAKDIFQDAVIILFSKVRMNHSETISDVSGFLYTVSRNLWINKAKRDQKMVLANEFPELVQGNEDFLDHIMTKEKEDAVQKIMNELGEPCKSMLRYTIWEELSLKETAEVMKLKNAGVAKTYNYRCKRQLLEMIRGNKYYQKILGRGILNEV